MKIITIPGSKSYTNRSLLLAALAKGTVKIINPLESSDTRVMIHCLKKLGIKITEKKGSIEVLNDISSIKNKHFDLDANESGTTIRFMLALSTIIPGIKILQGQAGLNKRPIGDLVEGLKQLGAKIAYLEKEGFPPVKVLSSKLNPGTIRIKGSISSQFISAILMIAPLIGEVKLDITGSQISKPYIDMTIDTMKQFGVKVENENYQKYVIRANQKYQAKKHVVEGDVSSASYFFAIAALTKSEITVKNINPKSIQADMKFLKILEKMGNIVKSGKNDITVIGQNIKPVSVDMQDCPDQVQTLAVLAAFAKGKTKITGVQSLRVKETDRVFALKKELKKMGISSSSTKTSLTIYGGNPKPAIIDTYGDHRMAMAFAVAANLLPDIKIKDPGVVNKTFPDFWKKLNSIRTRIHRKNIVLIGMRGSGKTIVAKMISRKLNKRFVELDEMLAEKMQMTITQIVKKYDWDFFRNKESELVKQVASQQNLVISTGGGVVVRQENIEELKRSGLIVYLNTSVETQIKRIGKKIGLDPKMPALTNKETPEGEIRHVFNKRKKLYSQAADEIIDTDKLNPEQVADKIISRVEGVL